MRAGRCKVTMVQLLAWLAKNPANFGQHATFLSDPRGISQIQGHRGYSTIAVVGAETVKTPQAHFSLLATGHRHEHLQEPAGEATHKLTKHAEFSLQCAVEDVQLADAENRGQKQRFTVLFRHTLLLLQRQASSGRTARRNQASGCPHLEQGWPQGSRG